LIASAVISAKTDVPNRASFADTTRPGDEGTPEEFVGDEVMPAA
jgi:hypothetical protein